jgi:hypothetical protein
MATWTPWADSVGVTGSGESVSYREDLDGEDPRGGDVSECEYEDEGESEYAWEGVGMGRACGAFERRIEPGRDDEAVTGNIGFSSSHCPVPSSTSSSFASLMTTTSRPSALLPSSMSCVSLPPNQSIWS